MNKILKTLAASAMAVCLLVPLAACKEEEGPSLTLRSATGSGYVGEEYDLKTLISDFDEGTQYSATGEYFDVASVEYVPVTIEGLVFTVDEEATVEVTITAEKNGKTVSEEAEINFLYRNDAVDEEILATWCDSEIQKTLSHDEKYLRPGSNSSVRLRYVGVNSHPYGVNFNCIDGTLLDEHWSITKEADPETAWENAVVSFWVYNDGDDPLQFCPRVAHAESGVNIDWTEDLIQTAAPNTWTHIYFSYRALGITTNFFLDEEGYFAPGGKQPDDYDTNYMKIQSAAAPEDQTTMYTFTAYIDDYDIVAYNDATKDQFPGLDTSAPNEGEKVDYTNLQYNEPAGKWVKDEEVFSADSEYSQKIYVEGDYSDCTAIFNIWAKNWKLLNLQNAEIVFDVKFGGAAEERLSLSFDIADETVSESVAIDLSGEGTMPEGISVTAADGWYRVRIDCAKAAALFENDTFKLDSVRKLKVQFFRSGTEEAWANFDNLFIENFTENA